MLWRWLHRSKASYIRSSKPTPPLMHGDCFEVYEYKAVMKTPPQSDVHARASSVSLGNCLMFYISIKTHTLFDSANPPASGYGSCVDWYSFVPSWGHHAQLWMMPQYTSYAPDIRSMCRTPHFSKLEASNCYFCMFSSEPILDGMAV